MSKTVLGLKIVIQEIVHDEQIITVPRITGQAHPQQTGRWFPESLGQQRVVQEPWGLGAVMKDEC